ncbi:MAG: DNA polymerase III subunit delta', partial [Rhodospirillales bacterium]
IAVIDAADEMNPSAANALLKVLEEPPANALLLLVTHNPGRMLPTIRSRCSKLALKPLDEDRLSALIAQSHPDLAPADAALLAHLADGSPGRALDLAEEGGLELFRDMTGLLETLPRLDIGALHSFGGHFIKAGQEESFQTVSGLLRWWLARLIVSVSGGTGASNRLNPQEELLATRLGQSAGLDRLFEVWEKINHLLDKADHAHLNRKQVILNVFLTLEDAVRS